MLKAVKRESIRCLLIVLPIHNLQLHADIISVEKHSDVSNMIAFQKHLRYKMYELMGLPNFSDSPQTRCKDQADLSHSVMQSRTMHHSTMKKIIQWRRLCWSMETTVTESFEACKLLRLLGVLRHSDQRLMQDKMLFVQVSKFFHRQRSVRF